MNTNERLLQAQCHDLKCQLRQAWDALEFYSGLDYGEAVRRFELLRGKLAKSHGGVEEANEVLGVGR